LVVLGSNKIEFYCNQVKAHCVVRLQDLTSVKLMSSKLFHSGYFLELSTDFESQYLMSYDVGIISDWTQRIEDARSNLMKQPSQIQPQIEIDKEELWRIRRQQINTHRCSEAEQKIILNCSKIWWGPCRHAVTASKTLLIEALELFKLISSLGNNSKFNH